ncbi:MAG TPA: large conductance mechanosensitive channel protein MscL [Tepidiformaceae bacterium]|nr:large conductance mechanosensitive channel protein MscL [Tepidiformaceae bacterium]
MLREFKEFLLRGNVIDLAVAIAIGVAFTAVVTALVNDLIMPVVAMLGGKPDFSDLDFTINDAIFRYGHFITELIAFIIIAAAIFFFVVKPANYLIQRSRKEAPADPTVKKCPECLSEIPVDARRCAYCTAEVGAAAGMA